MYKRVSILYADNTLTYVFVLPHSTHTRIIINRFLNNDLGVDAECDTRRDVSENIIIHVNMMIIMISQIIFLIIFRYECSTIFNSVVINTS